VRQLATLAFGPSGRPAALGGAAPVVRVAALSALAWGLATLLPPEPRRYALGREESACEGDYRHALLVARRLAEHAPRRRRADEEARAASHARAI
jgi:hypothetical protein